jgi:D-glycero-alpha-D-manno-heptose 1-phosphate guanylyltransferase
MTEPAPRKLSGVTAAVLAGGLGTRLRTALDDRPKVLAPVGGRPFLAYLLDALDAAGVPRIVLLIGYRGDQVRRELGNQYGGAELVYSNESSPLGTGGALREAMPLFDTQTLLLLNGDSYFGVDLPAFLRFHRHRRADLSLSLTRVDDAGRFGRVETDHNGRVTAFAEKQAAGRAGWINAGVYLMERRLLEIVPAGRPVSLEQELLPAWIDDKAVYGRRRSGAFLDVGTPESYALAESFCRNIASAPCSGR